jgi:hypothetical protein
MEFQSFLFFNSLLHILTNKLTLGVYYERPKTHKAEFFIRPKDFTRFLDRKKAEIGTKAVFFNVLIFRTGPF